ncbi:MAG: TIR domain-containing protein [Sphingomonas sp.]|nr:TIR domain-containing protein [Sphingomonas sp.]
MSSIFLSYAREDAARAKALAEALQGAGHDIWWDRHIRGGSEYGLEIQTALDGADVVLVLWSSASVKSEWVRDEATEGRDSGRLLPVTLDDSKVPLGFRQRQSIDLSSWKGSGRPPNIAALLKALETRTPSEERHDNGPLPAHGKPRHPFLLAGAALVALALLLVAGWYFAGERFSRGEATPTLAVMPFTDLSPEGKAYFAEGVAEAIVTMLARDPGIRVVGRSSVRQFQPGSSDVDAVRKALGVTHILEGSARTSGDDLRMNVRLIDAATGRQIWTEEYQRKMSNVFAVQDEIGRAVAERLSGSISAPTESRTQVTGADAYTLYLAGRAKMRDRDPQELKEALQLARQVIAADPDYAPGHALYAEALWQLSSANYGQIPVEQARKLGRPHALRAIALSPDHADGYAALGLLLLDRPAEALNPLKRAIQLDPSRAELRMWLAIAYNNLGRNAEALEHYGRVLEMEPVWRGAVGLYPFALAGSGRLDEAVSILKQFEARGGSAARAAQARSELAALTGDLSAAVHHSQRALKLDPDDPFAAPTLAWIYHRLAMPDLAQEFAAGAPLYSRLFYTARYAELLSEIRRAGAAVWANPDAATAISLLGHARDWPTLNRLYDGRPGTVAHLCYQMGVPSVRTDPLIALNFAVSLSKAGRTEEAAQLVGCIKRRVADQARSPVRSPHFSPSSLAFYSAQILAIEGQRPAALGELERAIRLGWVGPWPSLRSYPAFEGMAQDAAFNQLQRKLDNSIARERDELLRERPGPGT